MSAQVITACVDNGAIAFRDEHKLCFILFAKEPLGVFRFWIG